MLVFILFSLFNSRQVLLKKIRNFEREEGDKKPDMKIKSEWVLLGEAAIASRSRDGEELLLPKNIQNG